MLVGLEQINTARMSAVGEDLTEPLYNLREAQMKSLRDEIFAFANVKYSLREYEGTLLPPTGKRGLLL